MSTISQEMEIDLDPDFDIGIPFIGRDNDLHTLHEVWECKRIFGIFGIRSVGKSKFVHEFLARYSKSGDTILDIDLRQLANLSSLYSNLCIKLGVTSELYARIPDRWIQHIIEQLGNHDGGVVLVFDNAEDFQEKKGNDTRDTFLTLCTRIIRCCPNCKIIITSTTKVQFVNLGATCFSHKLQPLKPWETRRLLEVAINGISLEGYGEEIVRLSEGLPLLILMIGSELRTDGGAIKPKHIVERLLTSRLTLSKEFYPKEDRVADVYENFIDRLPEVYRDQLTILEYIPGSFNVDQVRQILDADTEAMVKYRSIKPLLGRHFLNYDSTSRRFDIQGILRECLHAYYIIRNLPEIRTRYCKIFTEVMVSISKRMNRRDYTKAMAEFTMEHPNLQKLLTDVQHTTQDNYKFFLQIATHCTGLVDNFMAGDGEEFYQGCRRLADMYGQEQDKATVYLAVGSFYTNTKGSDNGQESFLQQGLENYNFALELFQKHGQSVQLATTYQRIGWNLHVQSKNHEAVKYFKMVREMTIAAGKEYQPVHLQSLNSLGITLTVLGRFEEAEIYHFESLKRRQEIQGKDNLFIGACMNNIGLMYHQSGDHQNALQYYKLGLEIKRKHKTPVASLAASLSNTANMYSQTGDTLEAHRLLDEALRLLDGEKVTLVASKALIVDTKGKVFRNEGKLANAEEMFQNAVDIRKDISQNNVPYMESMVHLADIKKRQGQYEACVRLSKEALQLKEDVEIAMPQNPFTKECLECLSEVYRILGNFENYRETLWYLESELLRLEKVHLDHRNERDLLKVRRLIADVNDKIAECDSRNFSPYV